VLAPVLERWVVGLALVWATQWAWLLAEGLAQEWVEGLAWVKVLELVMWWDLV